MKAVKLVCFLILVAVTSLRAQTNQNSSGKTYKCKAWLEGDKLHLRGFLGFSMMGKTVVWHRYPSNTQPLLHSATD